MNNFHFMNFFKLILLFFFLVNQQAFATDTEVFPKIKIKGRIHHDWNWIDESKEIENKLGKQTNSSKVRRARLDISGDVWQNTDFALQLDFAGDDVSLNDLYFKVKRKHQPSITLGHFKEPFSIEELNSTNSTTFIEQGLPEAFIPARNNGLMLSSYFDEKRIGCHAGIFTETDNKGKSNSSGNFNITTRATWVPFYAGNGKKLLHLGLSHTRKNLESEAFRLRQRPETSLTDRFVDTGKIAAKYADISDLELSWQNHSLGIQGEYVQARIKGDANQSNLRFSGYYCFISYWLTGEHRQYQPKKGTFAFVKPNRNFDENNGTGAWELALRLSQIDLNDKNIAGGKMNSVTLGLNWHLNPNLRIMLNYIKADTNMLGKSDILLVRTQIHF
jgi:phosphate-selective porin OprO/OprP